MKLVEAITQYARGLKTDKAILSYLNTEDEVARYNSTVEVHEISELWLHDFEKQSDIKHVQNIKKVVKHFRLLS